MKKKFTQAIGMVNTRVEVSDIPKDIPAVPGTMAYPYLSRQRSASLMVTDPNLLGIIDPHDGQSGLLYVFKDGSSISGTLPSAIQEQVEARITEGRESTGGEK